MDYSLDDDGLAGKLLIAMPGIDDKRFSRAVILICAHSDEHAMGIVLNRIMDEFKLPELLEQMDVPITTPPPDDIILIGGPVGKDRGFVIHSEDFESIGATIPVGDGLRLTATKEVLQIIASDECPEKCRLALGYSGWGPMQLEEELKENVWLVADADDEIIFDDSIDDKWVRAMAKLGISPGILQSGLSGKA